MALLSGLKNRYLADALSSTLRVGISIALILFCIASQAHHSLAMFAEEIVQINGRLSELEWRNPHVRFVVEAINDRGLPEIWHLEANSIYNLRLGGLTSDRLSVGQQVAVSGRVSTRQVNTMLATSIVLEDGAEFVLFRTRPQLSDEDRVVDAAAENLGFFRVWSVPRMNIGPVQAQLGTQAFTESAIAARSAWDVFDNFATRCEPEGMPRIMVNTHPFEFIDHGTTITLRTELYDIERTIYLDRPAPADQPHSRLGYSFGVWEEDALVVTTTHLNWPYFDNIGSSLSEEAEIVERFTMSDDQTRLDFDITITDPATFTRPAKLQGHWLALGESISAYDCLPL